MDYSINLNNFKTVAVVATVLTTISCLVPESAQAGIVKGSGSATNSSTFNFDLNTSAPNLEGTFLEAIQNFNVTPTSGLGGAITNFGVCGNSVCPHGNVTITRLTTDSRGNISGLNFGLDELQMILPSLGSSGINFPNDVLRYDVTFVGTSSDPELIWFIQSNDSTLINDLSSLSRFSIIEGIFPRGAVLLDGQVNRGSRFTFSLQVPSEQVPEPSATASLVGIGGAVALLKRNKCLKKTV
jgi:hypothetical protein